ncbi:hypothetical protein L1889_15665 [Paenalcaligenes niemegkensis]|uniref:hypothetical protein n=1 Tax=Paenalcaligenes niemegkensis TaxID=2895469 RepID=UPI001EE7E17E|nr:hypothetical protein [Paenalcaligenes niemegkensis]MCQ9617929.1 hypothetical protein [Paenalcaligenes niemegkensis]
MTPLLGNCAAIGLDYQHIEQRASSGQLEMLLLARNAKARVGKTFHMRLGYA